jgi:hypothetical protein
VVRGGESMNRFRVWGLSTALAAAVGGPAVAADPAMSSGQTTLWDKLFGPKPPKPAGPAARSGPAMIMAPLSPEVIADALRAEQEAYLRRLSVCTELRRVADEQGDGTLARRADELERQVAALYNARVAALGVSRVRAPLPGPATTSGPEEPAPIKVAANRLTAPANPIPTGSTAQVREVTP